MRVSQFGTTVTRQINYALSVVVVFGWLVGTVYAQNCPQFAAPVVTGRLPDSRWTDISGLAASRQNPGVFWFHNDGGPGTSGSGDFFAVDREGRLFAEFRLDAVNTLQARGEGRVDIEDVAVGPAGPDGDTYLYLGDIGGNLYSTSRNELRIFRVREPQVSFAESNTGMVVITDYETFKVSYPNDIRSDAETLMVDRNGDLYIVTKAPTSGTSTVYLKAAPHWGGSTTTLEEVATLQFGSGNLLGSRSATAGDISLNGDEALIRTYSNVFMWVKPPEMTWGGAFASVTPCALPAAQGGGYEAVAFDHTGTHYYDTYDSQGSTSTAEPLNFYEGGVGALPAFEGYHDIADCSRIAGWAWDSSRPNTPISVDLYSDDARVATVLADVLRPDVRDAGKGDGIHGFDVITPASLKDGQPHSITVKFAGTATDLSQTPKTIACAGGGAAPSYEGFHDVASCSQIVGWAWDSSRPNTPIGVDIYSDGARILTVLADALRPDVRDAGKGDGVHGFTIVTPASLKDGQAHSIAVKFAGTATDLSQTPKTIACAGGGVAPPSFKGYHDVASCSQIAGWAWDSNRPDTPISVDIYSDDAPIATVLADVLRPDVRDAGKGNGVHGFILNTPASLRDNRPHSITVKFAQTQTDLSTTPKALSCAP